MNNIDQNFVSTSIYKVNVSCILRFTKNKVYPVWFNLIIVDRRKLMFLKIGLHFSQVDKSRMALLGHSRVVLQHGLWKCKD